MWVNVYENMLTRQLNLSKCYILSVLKKDK